MVQQNYILFPLNPIALFWAILFVFALFLPMLSPYAQSPSLSGQSGHYKQDFLSQAPDIPLAQGLQELQDEGFVFDKPEGRIVEIAANLVESHKNTKDILAFYAKTLPNLGWIFMKGDDIKGAQYYRLGEWLDIITKGELVLFRLQPAKK